jgi:protoheme IX farnesyltransferase
MTGMARAEEGFDRSSGLLRDVVAILKPRIALSITASALGGVAITPAHAPEAWKIAMFAVAVFLAAGAAGALNHWYEAELDASMHRTAGRPFASGRLNPNALWLVVILLLLFCAVAMAAFAANAWAALYTFLGAFTYAVIYTIWLKRRTWLNIVIGGLAGSFAVLAGSAMVSPELSAAPALLAIVLFLWTPPHFWSLAIASHGDYERTGIPMLPVVAGDKIAAQAILAHTVLLSLIALLPALYGMGQIYLGFALVGGAVFCATGIRVVQEPTRRRAIQNFLASLAQLVLLLAGIMFDRLAEFSF